jgi:3',5'-cyclic AMP phosphodiesterase CpdA
MPTLPTLKIAVLNDLHVGGPEGGGFQNTFLKADATRLIRPTVEAINLAGPDLVLIPGDLTHDATSEQLSAVRECLKLLDAPFVCCMGNHDRETPEGMARFHTVFSAHTRPGVTSGLDFGLSSDVAVLVLEASWREDGEPYSADNPPLAVIDPGIIEPALADLDRLWPSLLLVVCHYPLTSQAGYVRALGGEYAGHVSGGDDLLRQLVDRAGVVVCFTGHNHHHHIVTGNGWMQCATGALAECPAEYRLVQAADNRIAITTHTAVPDVVAAAPPPENPWVAGRPEDREFTWQPE